MFEDKFNREESRIEIEVVLRIGLESLDWFECYIIFWFFNKGNKVFYYLVGFLLFDIESFILYNELKRKEFDYVYLYVYFNMRGGESKWVFIFLNV